MNTIAIWAGVAVMGLIAVFLALRSPSDDSAKAPQASVEETAWQMVDHGALIVDVRSQQEFDQGHLEGALLIPYDEVAQRLAEFGDDTHRPIVLYCRSGNRAGKAEKVLVENGFTRVFNGGGYKALQQWRDQHPKQED